MERLAVGYQITNSPFGGSAMAADGRRFQPSPFLDDAALYDLIDLCCLKMGDSMR
jgi:hypothetical protein